MIPLIPVVGSLIVGAGIVYLYRELLRAWRSLDRANARAEASSARADREQRRANRENRRASSLARAYQRARQDAAEALDYAGQMSARALRFEGERDTAQFDSQLRESLAHSRDAFSWRETVKVGRMN